MLILGQSEYLLRFENLCLRESTKRLWIEKSVGVLKESNSCGGTGSRRLQLQGGGKEIKI
jgi:hypothetical protein